MAPHWRRQMIDTDAPAQRPSWDAPDPVQIAAVRERVADYLQGPFAHMFTAAVLASGKGTIRPVADPAKSAELLLADECRRLQEARLYYVTRDLVPLVEHAARNHRGRWDIQPHDLPAPSGFMVFAEPFASYVGDSGQRVDIVAASWGPSRMPSDGLPDGLWVTFWSTVDRQGIATLYREHSGLSYDEALREVLQQHAELAWDNEIYMPWGADEVVASDEDDQVRVIDPSTIAAARATIDWLRVLHAAWVFCQPNNFTDTLDSPLPRSMRRRAERSGHDSSPVRVVSVRHRHGTASRPSSPSGRTLTVRFPVGPYMRRQAFGPGRRERRWQLVSGSWRGPVDAPVRIRPTVHLIDTAPPPSTGGQ